MTKRHVCDGCGKTLGSWGSYWKLTPTNASLLTGLWLASSLDLCTSCKEKAMAVLKDAPPEPEIR